ncbi:MAG: DNA repair protein RecO [Clostridia bacterium]|nr:DNA repair protein RecO [Clostridia bacterium]
MDYAKFRGIVIRSTDYGEGDRLLTILAFEKGMLTIRAKGVRRKGAKLSHCAQLFFCGDFECVSGKGRYVLTGGSRLYDYTGIADDLEKYYHACHFIEIASAVIMEDQPDDDMLRLLLNTMHVMISSGMDLDLLTAIYELRTAVITGFAPVTGECAVCGKTQDEMVFSPDNGGMVCCVPGMPVDKETAKAIAHISSCEDGKLFSIRLPKKQIAGLKKIGTKYLEFVLDRKFGKLEGFERYNNGGGSG